MADPEVRIIGGDADVEMQGGNDDNVVEVPETGAANGDDGNGINDGEVIDGGEKLAPRAKFVE